MTPDDLAIIRARDAEATSAHLRRHIAYRDRRALLAEIDRLEAAIATAVLDRTVYPTGAMVKMADAYVEGRVAAERARIRAGVEGLPFAPCVAFDYADVVDRAAVLAVVEGEG